MKATSRKLRKLENCIIDFKVEDGSTILSAQCMSAGEIELHNRAGKLLELRRDFANELLKKIENDPEVDVSEIVMFFNEKEQAIVDASPLFHIFSPFASPTNILTRSHTHSVASGILSSSIASIIGCRRLYLSLFNGFLKSRTTTLYPSHLKKAQVY